MKITLYEDIGVPLPHGSRRLADPDRRFLAVVTVSKHVSVNSYAATAEEAVGKAEAHIEAQAAKAAKRPGKKPKAAPAPTTETDDETV